MTEQFFERLRQPSPVPVGTRIKLTAMPQDPDPVPIGSTGTVEEGSNGAQLHIKWDNGRTLGLVVGVDRYDVIVPKHEHQWVFARTDSDWWDGDEEDVYRCSVAGCLARDRRYIPR